jgi:hypothetical protein
MSETSNTSRSDRKILINPNLKETPIAHFDKLVVYIKDEKRKYRWLKI